MRPPLFSRNFLMNGMGLFPAVLAGLQEIEGNAGFLGHPLQLVFGRKVVAADIAGLNLKSRPQMLRMPSFSVIWMAPVGQMKWQAPQPMQTMVGST